MDNIAEKIKEISAKFDLAETLVNDTEILQETVEEIKEQKQEYNPIDVMSLEIMAEDFSFSRKTLKESITFGRKVLEEATKDLLLAEGKNKANNTLAFAELTTAVLNGVKVHSQLYKDFSTVLLNIKKINENKKDNISVTNNLNVTESISTTDLIERLKKSTE